MTTLDVIQGSEEWHQAKLGMITGTRFSTVMSKETTEGYKKLILSLAGEILTRTKEPSYVSKHMERGVQLEPEAREFYENEFGVTVDETGLCYPDDETINKWVAVSPDGLINNDGGLEIKCPMMETHLGYIRKQTLPTVYRPQVQGTLFVTGRKWWDFMSYFPDLKPFIIRVEPDKEYHDRLNERIHGVIRDVTQVMDEYQEYQILS